jgi:hypothetical protein
MTRGTKIALISLGLLVVGVGVYMVVSNNKKKSGNKQKDDRKITIVSTTK